MQHMQTKTIVRTCAIAMSILAAGCSGGGSATGANGGETVINSTARPLFFDSFGVIPANKEQSGSYTLFLNNISNKNYTLESISVKDAGGKEDAAKLALVAGKMCGTLAAGNRCGIEITPKTAGKSATVILSVTMRSDDGEEKIVNQIIRMSNKVGNKGGIYFRNDISELNASDGNYGISVPVLLEEDYDDIKASNGDLLCSSKGFTKGNSCTLTIHGRALKDNTLLATELTAYRNGKVAEVISSTSKVTTQGKAELLLSHGNEVIADGKQTEMITVFNDGGIEATDINKTLAANSKLKLVSSSDSCATTLNIGDACQFAVTATSDANGEDSVTVNYNDGLVRKANSVSTNVSYFAESADIRLTVTASGSLENTLVGSTAIQTLNIKNDGNRDIDNLNFAHEAVDGISIAPAASNACGKKLAKTKSCDMAIKYTPTKEQAKNDLRVNIAAEYKNAAGTVMQHRQAYTTPYSALNPANVSILSMTTSDATELSILTNNTSTAGIEYVIRNTSSITNGYTAVLVGDPLFSSTINGLGFGAGGCSNNTEIAAADSCKLQVTYGPVDTAQAKTEVEVSAKYQIKGVTTAEKTVSSDKFSVEANATAAIIQTTLKLSGAAYTGTGLINDPYKFMALSNNTLNLSYTLKNVGNITADKLGVKAQFLPSGAQILNTSTCPSGVTQLISLAAGSECTFDLAVPKDKFFDNPLDTINPSVTKGSFKLPLVYSMDGQEHNATTHQVDFSRDWANASYAVDSITSTRQNHLVKIKATLKADTSIATPVSINLRNNKNQDLDGLVINNCTINSSEGSCIIEANFPRDKFFAGENIMLDFGALGANMDARDTVYGRVIVTIPDAKDVVTLAELTAVKPLLVTPDGKEITINNKPVIVGELPDTLPPTPSGEKPQITNAFSLGDNSNLILAQTNSNGNQLVIVKPDGSTTPVAFPTLAENAANPLNVEVLSTTLDGKVIALATDPGNNKEQYVTIDAAGQVVALGTGATAAANSDSTARHHKLTPVALPGGFLLVSDGSSSTSHLDLPRLYVLGKDSYHQPFGKWLEEHGYDISNWNANEGSEAAQFRPSVSLAPDNNIYLVSRNTSGGGSYVYQLDSRNKVLRQLGNRMASLRFSGKVVYADPIQQLYYFTSFSNYLPNSNGYLHKLEMNQDSSWVAISDRIKYHSMVFRPGSSGYPEIYALGNNSGSGFYKSNGKDRLVQIKAGKDIKWSKWQLGIVTDSAGDMYSISAQNQLVRLSTQEEVYTSGLADSELSIQPTESGVYNDPRVSSYKGKIYVKAVDNTTKAVSIYVYDKSANRLVLTNYKALPRE